MNASYVADFDPYPFEEFAPTLSQCFVIVTVGYLLARLEILSPGDVKGVVGFASYFAMPAIICVSLADADFGDFRWELLLGVFLGKFLTFVAVSGFLILLDGNVGVAGTVALFCAQSNDLPVGNPLMSSLYRNHRPQMMKYLFLIPAVTAIFVPFTNIMVRMHRAGRCNRQLEGGRPDYKECMRRYLQDKEHLSEMYGVAKNPVVVATLLGLILNVVFGGKVPEALHQPIKVAAATIPGIALAMLGFSFVRKERYLLSSAVVPAAVLLILKMVITPILLHVIVRSLTDGSQSSKLLSDFSLLYGIISPATAVFLTGQEFRKSLAVMSVALVLTSFGCFPVSYVVARITIAPIHKLSTYVPLLKHVLFWVACISLSCDVLVWITLIWRKRWRQVPSCYTSYLVFTQVVSCAGVLVWSLGGQEPWLAYCHLALYYGGEISGYLWTGTLAVVLVLKEYMLTEGGFSILCFTAFSVSAMICAIMCLLLPYGDVQRVYVVARPRSNFQYMQLIVTTIFLSISLIVVTACLLYHFKKRKSQNENTEVSAYENTVYYIQEQDETSKEINNYKMGRSAASLKIEDKLGESEETRIYYDETVRTCESEDVRNEALSSQMRDWTFRLSSLLTLQGLVMLVRFLANLFKLIDNRYLEVMIPIEFLQSTLFVGQGVFILLTLGIDVRTSVLSFRKWRRRVQYGKDELPVGSMNIDEKGEAVQFCSQFYNFYYDRCFRDIAMERRWKGTVYQDSFWGHQLVDWMVSEGLCHSDTDAEGNGQKLLEGGAIAHVEGRHHFYDAPYLYYFTRKENSAKDSGV